MRVVAERPWYRGRDWDAGCTLGCKERESSRCMAQGWHVAQDPMAEGRSGTAGSGDRGSGAAGVGSKTTRRPSTRLATQQMQSPTRTARGVGPIEVRCAPSVTESAVGGTDAAQTIGEAGGAVAGAMARVHGPHRRRKNHGYMDRGWRHVGHGRWRRIHWTRGPLVRAR